MQLNLPFPVHESSPGSSREPKGTTLRRVLETGANVLPGSKVLYPRRRTPYHSSDAARDAYNERRGTQFCKCNFNKLSPSVLGSKFGRCSKQQLNQNSKENDREELSHRFLPNPVLCYLINNDSEAR